MQLLLLCSHYFLKFSAGMNLMGFISHIPTLKGDNYGEWIKKVDLAFVCGEVDEMINTPKPTEPPAPVRGESDTDTEWQEKQRDYAPIKMAYDLQKIKWNNANKKCVAVIKNTIDPNILGSIGECDSAAEYLEKIKNQFTSFSKTYATQIIEQLVTKRYYGNAGTIRDHIMGMCTLNSKLKPMNLDLKEEFMVHLVFASLPKEFATFVVNYNSQPEKWNMEKSIAMCAQKEDRLKKQNGGSVNFVHNNKKGLSMLLLPLKLKTKPLCHRSISNSVSNSALQHKMSASTVLTRGIVKQIVPL